MKAKHLFALALLSLGCASSLSHAVEIFSDNFETVASDGWARWTGYPNATVTDNQNRAIENTGSQIFGRSGRHGVACVDSRKHAVGKVVAGLLV